MNGICKICGEKTREIFHKGFNLKFYCCDACDFISKDSAAIMTKEEEMKRYDLHQNSIADVHYVEYFKKFIEEAVLKYCPEGRRGLDFGSGPSPVLAMILERDYQFSMDIYDLFYSPNKIYENQKYDLVTSTEVVEHLENPMDYFRLFKELLKPEGVLSIMTLFHPKNDAEFLNWHYMRDMSHISFYTPKTMEIIAAQLGLNIIYGNNRQYTTFKAMK